MLLNFYYIILTSNFHLHENKIVVKISGITSPAVMPGLTGRESGRGGTYTMKAKGFPKFPSKFLLTLHWPDCVICPLLGKRAVGKQTF